ncbi:S8 family serine peptidase [Oceanicoccus sp. KOV_DT_Chl]|uniref:S8 family serine peptidase n=1 Tax=Oceanicoccus sp. KOV_DT_Chl TaxID=1904639 RepID=UPI000C7CA3A5|nr:S8 family serine peptidase [Oceanicoccus sp. KOV_DT_Chl]
MSQPGSVSVDPSSRAARVPIDTKPAAVVTPPQQSSAATANVENATPTPSIIMQEEQAADSAVIGSPRLSAPILSEGNKLQRGGSLLNQSPPMVPVLINRKTTLAPLRQILITATTSKMAEQQRKQLAQYQLRIASRKSLDGLGLVLSAYRVPDDSDIDELVETVKKLFPDSIIEKNKRYRLLSSKQSYGQKMVGLGVPSRCRKPLQIAMLDSAINTDLSLFSSDRVRFYDVTGTSDLPQDHGSAVASLLISDVEKFPGLLPAAHLQAINVFAYDSEHEPETRTDWILKGLDLLSGLSPTPQAVNLSFGGEHSQLVEYATNKLSNNMLFVAAAGNDGSEQLVYPAAYAHVYAVGAVNARGEKTRQSNYGKHIKLLAPGEDIWTRNGKGAGSYMNGTSFSAPFATAALAVVKSEHHSVDDYVKSLGETPLLDFTSLCKAH